MRRVPLVVWALTVLHLALLATYSVAYPTWTGYDEAQHVDMVYGLLHGSGWPGPGEKQMSQGVAATSDDFDRGRYADMFQSGGKRRGSPSFAEITPTPRAQRESFDALGGPGAVTDGRLSNQMVQHPPMVYAVGAAVLWALPADNWAYDEQVYVLRVLNILLVAPLPLLAWATARRLRLPEAAARGAAVLPLAIPGFTRVGATFNNDGVLMLTTGALTFVLAGVLRGDRRLRTAALAGLWLGLTLLSKGLALLLPLMVVAAYLVGAWHRHREAVALGTAPAREGPRGARLRAFVVSLPWGPALLALGLAVAIGGWWWVRNEALYGALQPNGWATNPPRREPLLLPDSFWTWFVYFAATMCNRFWAGLGMFEPPQLTPVAIVGASVVAGVMGVACLVTGFGPGRSRLPVPAQAAPGGAPAPPRRSWRERLIGAVWRVAPPAVMLAPVVFPYVTVGQRSWAEYERYTRGIAVQGRYLYMGIVGVGVVIALGMARLLGRRRERWTPLVLLVGALLMQAFALLAICSYYWLGRGVNLTPARVPDAAAAIARWAPFPVGVTFTIMIATGLAVVLALVVVARSAAHDRPGPAAPGMATAAVASPPGAALPAVPSPPASSSTTSPSPTGM